MQNFVQSYLWPIYLVAAGACVGSFLGVVIERLPLNQSIVWPGSRCDHCQTPLRWFDNVPVFSYLVLRGRCRTCRASYGPRMLVLELLMAALTLALWQRFGLSLSLVAWLPMTAALLAITFLDIDHFWVPDVITYPALVWAALWACTGATTPTAADALWGLVPAAMLWALASVFARCTGKEGMGLGDIKLLAVLGVMLGGAGGLTALFLASLQGSAAGGVILAAGGHRERERPELMESVPETERDTALSAGESDSAEAPWEPDPHAVPFGPFLVLGGLEVMFFPEAWSWGLARLRDVLAP